MAKTKVHGEYLDPSVISGQTQVTAVGADSVLIFDATDNALKKALVSDLAQNEENPTFTGDVTLTSSTSSKPRLNITNTNADDAAPQLRFSKDSASPADNDEVGRIYMFSDDDAGNPFEAVLVRGIATDVSNGAEASQLEFFTYGSGSQKTTLTLDQGKVAIGHTSPNGLLDATATHDGYIAELDNRGTGGGNHGLYVNTQSTSAYGLIVKQNEDTKVYVSNDELYTKNRIKLNQYSYIGEDLIDLDSLHIMSHNTESIIFGQHNTTTNAFSESFRINSSGDMNAPGTVVQTVRASNGSASGTGAFDIVSVNITPKFADSDMVISVYCQWSVLTNNGDDWGMGLLRDGTTILGESVNNYFISGGGVDAADWLGQGANAYGVNFAAKTDIDTGRSSGTSQITYKLRRLTPSGTSKNVIFMVDGWGGGSAESNRSLSTIVVQEVIPN